METRTDFLIARDDLRRTSCADVQAVPLRPGEARLWIDRFAVTANNVTYALFGDKMEYWGFFPAPDGLGRLPVWGFADVVESRAHGLAEGERIYGYLPIATELVVEVADLTGIAFVNPAPHRRDLANSYNRYMRTGSAEAVDRALEPFHAIFHPLFATAFLIDDQFKEDAFYGARTVLISSASSKTALATAFIMRRADRAALETVGLTSRTHERFVEKTGYYHRVVTYDALDQIAVEPFVYVDMAGRRRFRVTAQASSRLMPTALDRDRAHLGCLNPSYRRVLACPSAPRPR